MAFKALGNYEAFEGVMALETFLASEAASYVSPCL